MLVLVRTDNHVRENMARYTSVMILAVAIVVACSIAIIPLHGLEGSGTTSLLEVSYDSDSGTVTFSGTSSAGLVNVIVTGPSYSSPVDPCVVSGTTFGHTLSVGQLAAGTYTVTASAPGHQDSRTFTVQQSSPQPAGYVTISSVSYDKDSGTVTFSGTSSAGLVNVIVTGPSYSSPVDPCVVSGTTFGHTLSVGQLAAGTYTVTASASDMSDEASFTVTASIGSVQLSSDGTVLLSVTGHFDSFTIPSTVTTVESGAFASCTIDNFVYDRDVNWRISLSDGTYPMENANISVISIGDSVTSIPDYLFAKTEITSLSVPSSIESIGIKAFYHCDNLETITVCPNSRLTTIDQYAFSSNNELRMVTFESSQKGYGCDILRGAFFLNPSLTKVNVGSGFNLVSIGDFAFAKRNNNINPDAENASLWSLAVNINSDSGMVIPATVNSIGFAAFSWVDNVPWSNKEPGMNTISENAKGSTIDRRILTSEGFSIIFAQGSQLGSVGDYAFSGYSYVSTIDLSECKYLVEIGRGSFLYSVSGDSQIKLSESLLKIGKEAFKSGMKVLSGSQITVPASVQYIGDMAFDCVSLVKFEQGSDLRNYMGSSSNVVVDLRNCDHLEYVDGQKVMLPVGVFECDATIVDSSTPLASVQSSVLTIGDNTVAVNKKGLEKADSIICSGNNSNFSYEDDILFLTKNGKSKLVLVMSDSTTLTLTRSGLVIENGVIPGIVQTLIVGGGISFAESCVNADSSLETIIFTHPLDGSWDVIDAFNGGGVVNYFADADSSNDVLRQLSVLGDLYLGYHVGSSTVYVPCKVEGHEISYSVSESSEMSLILNINDTISRVLLPECTDANVRIMDGKLCISDVAKNRVTVGLNTEGITILFDGNGGLFEGIGKVSRIVPKGSDIASMDIPQFIKNRCMISGWSTEPNGEPVSESTVFSSNTILYACWTQRNPELTLDCTAASISVSPSITGNLVTPGSYTLTCRSVNNGYEVLGWMVNGEIVSGSIDEPLVLNVQDDTTVSLMYRFHSSSSGLDAISNRGMPTSEEILQMVQAYSLGGPLDTSSNIWKGHSSVPLIVDDRVYFRAGNYLYVAESDTGYVLKSVPSREAEAYYHSVGYGAGVIVDYPTSKVYDLDLNQLYVLDRQVTGVEYYDGYFYTSGSSVYRFTPDDVDVSRSDESKQLEFIGTIEKSFSSYGFTSSVFVDHYLYRIVAEGASRGIGVMDLDTKQVGRFYFDSLESMFLDDGWISYYNGVLYMSAYSEGLFGAVGSINNSRIAYCTVDGLNHGTEKYYEFSDNGFVSQFLVVGGIGYVNCESKLYAFDMSLGELRSPRSVDSSFGHGSMSVDVSHMDEVGSPVYIYMIPYDGYTQSTFCIIKDSGIGAQRHLEKSDANYLPRQWNSQTVRPDIDGRIVWYNDSGHIFTYTTPEKNPYYFFVNDGEKAGWYQAYGKNMYDAARSLGDEILSIDGTFSVSRMFGNAVTGTKITAVHAPTDTIMQYDWSVVDSFNNRHFDTDHYFIIIAGDANVQKGSVYTYWDGSAFKTYTFKENIGDRSLIGVQMVPGNSASMVQFFEGDEEIDDSYILGIVGSDVLGDFPRVHKDGYLPVWKDSSGNEVTSLEGTKFVSGGTVYKLSWEKIHSYEISVTKTEVKDNTLKLEYTIETTDESGLNIQVQAAYSDMTFVREPIEAKIAEDGKITLVYTNTGESAPVKALVTAYKGNILVLAEYIDLTESGSS